ncbi:hypothetical protein HMPREF1207_01830 [Paenibacillus sp. HGH0039]|nr:hypothetical protein HMPREF1207_01830 [Paenibacillus sp. HGH0039]
MEFKKTRKSCSFKVEPRIIIMLLLLIYKLFN